MTYAKFVTRLNKEGKPVNYGPYYYKSIRTSDGKVRNIYLGIKPVAEENGNEKTSNMKRLRQVLIRLVAS